MTRLRENEAMLAAYVGARRHVDKLFRGQRDRYGAEARLDQWSVDIEAAGAEMAVAKVLGLYWTGANGLHDATTDVGRLQVRNPLPGNQSLLVRPSDADDHGFVLVTGTIPRFEVVGWMLARDAKRPEWRRDPGGHGAAYFVPQEELHDVSEISARPRTTPPPAPPLDPAELFA